MKIDKEINLLNGKDDLYFETMNDFKTWSDNLYEKHKNKEDANILITAQSYERYGEIFDNVNIILEYEEEENENELLKRVNEEKLAEEYIVLQKFIVEKNIPNTIGLVHILNYLKKGILKYSYEEFLNFKENLLNKNVKDEKDV